MAVVLLLVVVGKQLQPHGHPDDDVGVDPFRRIVLVVVVVDDNRQCTNL